MPEYRRGMPADERVWTMVYRGDLAVRVERRGLIPAARMPAHLRHALAQRDVAQLGHDYTRRGVTAAWNLLRSAVDWFRSPETAAPVMAAASSPGGQAKSLKPSKSR